MTDQREDEPRRTDDTDDAATPHEDAEAGGGPSLDDLGGAGDLAGGGGLADARPSDPDEAGTGPGGGA